MRNLNRVCNEEGLRKSLVLRGEGGEVGVSTIHHQWTHDECREGGAVRSSNFSRQTEGGVGTLVELPSPLQT